MKRSNADIVREYGPLQGVSQVHGVSWDGHDVWFATGEQLHALDPASGAIQRTLEVAARAGTAFDGRHLYQIADGCIQRIDPATGQVLGSIPAPAGGDNAGLAWAEGTLWLGQYRQRRILQLDPHTGAVLRTIESNRYVTGVTWVERELWHGTWEDEASELRRVDAGTGEVLHSVAMPPGMVVSGLESDGGGLFYCGGGNSGALRAVRRPTRRLEDDAASR